MISAHDIALLCLSRTNGRERIIKRYSAEVGGGGGVAIDIVRLREDLGRCSHVSQSTSVIFGSYLADGHAHGGWALGTLMTSV